MFSPLQGQNYPDQQMAGPSWHYSPQMHSSTQNLLQPSSTQQSQPQMPSGSDFNGQHPNLNALTLPPYISTISSPQKACGATLPYPNLPNTSQGSPISNPYPNLPITTQGNTYLEYLP